MCKFIGVEVLAANALIDIMGNMGKTSAAQASISRDDLDKYGMAVVNFINKKFHEGAVILYKSDVPDTSRFINYSDLLEYDDKCVRVRSGVKLDQLYRRCRVPLAYEILTAVYDPGVQNCLQQAYM